MESLPIEIVGGRDQEPFTCTSCKQRRAMGDECLELHVLDRIFGPLCVDCWPKVPAFLEQISSQPGLKLDVAKIKDQVMARYEAAEARGN